MASHVDRIDQYLDDVLGPVLLDLVHRGRRKEPAAPSQPANQPDRTLDNLKNALGGSEGLTKFAAGLKVAGAGQPLTVGV